jgi:hypothetical protein
MPQTPPDIYVIKNWTDATILLILKRADGKPPDRVELASNKTWYLHPSLFKLIFGGDTRYETLQLNNQGPEFPLEYAKQYSIFRNRAKELSLVEGISICSKCVKEGKISALSFGKCTDKDCGTKTKVREFGEDAAIEGGKGIVSALLKALLK